MSNLHENLGNRYDSDGNIAPFFDTIASESLSLNEVLIGNDDPNSNISISPDHSLNKTRNTNSR